MHNISRNFIVFAFYLLVNFIRFKVKPQSTATVGIVKASFYDAIFKLNGEPEHLDLHQPEDLIGFKFLNNFLLL
jgi:hypothetical protein